MALDGIKIEGFKSVREMDLELRNLNVLIGSNGSGKSNFISIFKLLNQIVEENLQLYVAQSGGADTFLHFGQKSTSKLSIRLCFGQNGYEADLVPTLDGNLIFAKEECWFQKQDYDNPYTVKSGSGHKETRLVEKAQTGGVAQYVLENMKDWKIYHFHDTSDSALVKKKQNIDDNAVFKADASNLAAFLYLLQEKNHSVYDVIVRTIRLAVPFFEDFVLRPAALNPNKIQLEWREKGHPDTYFNAHSLSDGSLRFICLATLLLQPTLPSTILIDEPELGLHPYAITLLASMLRSAATKTQVIVSTQSVPLVNQFLPEDIIVVDRKDGQSEFKRLKDADVEIWLEEFGLGEIWEKNIIGGRP